MAILTEVAGIIATIEVNGQDLPEFDAVDETTNATPSTSPGPSTTKYIEATSNARFALITRFTKDYPYPEDDLILRLYLDGQFVAWKAFTPREIRRRSRKILNRTCRRHGERVFVQFFEMSEVGIGMCCSLWVPIVVWVADTDWAV